MTFRMRVVSTSGRWVPGYVCCSRSPFTVNQIVVVSVMSDQRPCFIVSTTMDTV
jgi:hypothetical protein